MLTVRRLLGVGITASVLCLVPSSGAAQTPTAGLSSFVVRATALGVTARETSIGAVPAGADVVVVASSLAEAELTSASSTGLAALPYPTEQVLSVPGAAAGLGGIPAPPGYPLVARADHPFTPQAAATPQGQPGATVTATADERHAVAVADGPAAAIPSDQLTVPPEAGDTLLSVGQVRTHATATRLDDGALEVVATSRLSDVAMLGGTFRAGQVTALATLVLRDGKAEPGRSEVAVGDATLADAPVGVTGEGLVLGPQSVPLSPVATSVNGGIRAAGIEIFVTPATQEVDGATAHVRSGSVRLRLTTELHGFPLVVELDLGGTEVSSDAVADAGSGLEVAPLSDAPAAAVDATVPAAFPELTPATSATGAIDGFAAPSGAVAAPASAATTLGGGTSFTPVGSTTLDFRPVYVWLVLLGGAALVARRLALRGNPSRTGPVLSDLWRW